jgi:multiple sugar transport system ATP-binding protein
MTIELRQLVKAFGQRVVVDRLNLDVKDGAFTVLLGPSGCGKTTTLRMIAGLESPNSGDIILNNRNVTQLSPKARGVAMVFQDYGLYPHMSVLDNVAFPLKISGIPLTERKARATEMLTRLRLEHLVRHRPGQISGGEKQRVSLARALVRRPSIMLMDEPLSNLDAMLRARMRAEIKTLHQEFGTTTLYVTHDQIEALSLGTAIAVMRSGKVEQYATPMEIYHKPQTLFVARFVGSPQMNLLPVTMQVTTHSRIAAGKGFKLLFPGEGGSAVDAIRNGADIILGVRPEHFVLDTSGSSEALSGIIRLIEPLGQDQYIHVSIGEETIIARTDPQRTLQVGESIGLRPSARNLHLFDSTTEQRIH